MAYVQATENDKAVLRALMERLGVGKVVETIANIEADWPDSAMGRQGREANAAKLHDCADSLVYAWVEE